MEYSNDEGVTWQDYQNGEWIATGQDQQTDHDTELSIVLDPPIQGNAFKIKTTRTYRTHDSWVLRFDFWLTPVGDLPVDENPLSITYSTIASLSDCALGDCSVVAFAETDLHGGDSIMAVKATSSS